MLAMIISLLVMEEIAGAKGCGSSLQNEGNITSPGYPASYPENSECTWTLHASDGKTVHLSFVAFDLEPFADNLVIYQLRDGQAPEMYDVYTGNTTLDLNLTNGVMLRFLSDASDNRRGFFIAFTSENASYAPASTVTATAVTTAPASCGGNISISGVITSPGYPTGYPSDTTCTWYLTASNGAAVHLEFTDFDLEKNFDWLIIYNSIPPDAGESHDSFTGSTLYSPQTFGSRVTVRFTSDSSIEGRGFSAIFSSSSSVTVSTRPPAVVSVSSNTGCGGDLSDEGYISSPNYPKTYPNGALCEWRLTAAAGKVLSIQVLLFATEPNRDFLRLYDASLLTFNTPFTAYTGFLRPTTTTYGSFVTAIFKSDQSGSLQGFRIRFTSVQPLPTPVTPPVVRKKVCGGWLFGSGYLTSPGYPRPYPKDTRCEWKVRAKGDNKLLFYFLTFMLESTFDVLTIFTGNSTMKGQRPAARYSGNQTATYAVFASNVTVVFTSDDSVQLRGFRIKVTCVRYPRPYGVPQPSVNSTGICGVPSVPKRRIQPRVVGGNAALPESVPWQAMLRVNGSLLCGGSLIADRWVITAAHCFLGLATNSPASFTIFLGKRLANSTEDGEVKVQASRIILHPRYTEANNDNDICLVKLQRAVEFNNKIRPICLPSSGTVADQVCYASGFGDDSTLKQVSLPIVGRSACRNYLFKPVTKNMLCAGWPRGGQDTCKGDSGGPLACEQDGRLVIEGITSWGSGCGDAFSPGVYTRVLGYVDWIGATILGPQYWTRATIN